MATYRILRTRRDDGANSLYGFITYEKPDTETVTVEDKDEMTGEVTGTHQETHTLDTTTTTIFEATTIDAAEDKVVELLNTYPKSNLTIVSIENYDIDLIFSDDTGHKFTPVAD